MNRTTSSVATVGLALSILLGLAVPAVAQGLSTPIGAEAFPLQKLAGTVEGENQQFTGAVFEDPQTKRQRAYHIGDVIDGATIVEIKRQQVVLKRGEEFVVVRITGGSQVAIEIQPIGDPGKRVPDNAIPVPAGDAQQARQTVISKVIAPYDPRVEKLKTAIPRKDVNRFVDYFQARLKEESPVLVTTAIGPAVDLAGVDPEILESLRLESTDLIVEISGMGVDSLDRFRQILRMFADNRRGGGFNISVLRGEAVQPLYYTLQ